MLALSEDSGTDEPKTEKAKTIESLNDQAFNLCIEISRFTENPIFKSKGVYHGATFQRSRQDLGRGRFFSRIDPKSFFKFA